MPEFMFISKSPDLLLDNYTATAAYSVRKLRSAYAGSCMRIRRSSDNTEQDIGFSGNDLDTAAITSFVGANSAFVVTWYDQSANGRDVTTATAANQPRIVNAGTIEVKNGKSAIRFIRTSTTRLRRTLVNISLLTNTTHSVSSFVTTPNAQNILALATTQRYYVPIGNGTNSYFGYNASAFATLIRVLDTNQYLYMMKSGSGTVFNYENGVQKGTFASVSFNSAAIEIGVALTSANPADALIQECVWLASDIAGNRVAYETNINSYFGIY